MIGSDYARRMHNQATTLSFAVRPDGLIALTRLLVRTLSVGSAVMLGRSGTEDC